MEKRVKILVVDSGAFIKNSPVHEYAENIFTVNGAVKEIKDKATLQRLQFLPYSLQIKEPSPEACKYVLEFSKKTGDYSSLSLVDMQILALTYQLEKENVGTEHLHKEPSCKITEKSAFADTNISGFYVPKKVSSNTISLNGTDECESESDSDEESWLTSHNINEVQEEMGALTLDTSLSVACVTTDFCIQNVLIQMGLNVISVDGMLIKQARVFILRCYSCYKTTNNMTKEFCPNCGNKTLKRVAVTVNDDGKKNIHINFRRPINIRGTRYSLPQPKGGKHSVNPVLVEDQPIPHNRPGRKAMEKIDVMSEDYVARSSPFVINDVFSRAASLGIRSNNKHQLSRRNPNSSSKCTGNRKK